MCGIAGIIKSSGIDAKALKSMTDSISHRGPDGEGHWTSADGRVGLGHRRLAIIDVTSDGAQPMHLADRYTITYNGEIYNYIELREMLKKEGHHFNTASDTEVLLVLYHVKKEMCLDYLDGMFSFVIYDKLENTIFCARDRFGEKPFFYFYEPGQQFVFGSEIKALWAAGVEKTVNERMLFSYIAFGILENADDKSESFFSNIHKLEPAHFIKIKLDELVVEKRCYWEISVQMDKPDISFEDAIGQFKDLMETSVKRRLRSDVPVGSSLSGGLDSSLIVCLVDQLKNSSKHEQKTFSARFPGFSRDEGKFMQMVIDKTNVHPYFVYPDEKSLFSLMDKVAFHQEEPFGSASVMVQYQVMRLAKENDVIVLLDGQGADEILAGYHYYYPAYLRELKVADKSQYSRTYSEYRDLHADNTINKYNIMKEWALENLGPFVNSYFSLSADLSQYIHGHFEKDFYRQYRNQVSLSSKTDLYRFKSLDSALHYSTFTKGLHELLRYADRNSMANSREVRLPFLSHELVEFLFSLPSHYKLQGGWTKYLMRKAYSDLLPASIAWRKDKIGYEPPQNAWLQTREANDRIEHSKEILKQHQILSVKAMKQNPGDLDSAKKWRYIMSAAIFV